MTNLKPRSLKANHAGTTRTVIPKEAKAMGSATALSDISVRPNALQMNNASISTEMVIITSAVRMADAPPMYL